MAEPVDAHRYQLLLEGMPLAEVDVDHVNLSRVEAALGPDGRLAVTVHHGREGGASLRLLDPDQVLLATSTQDGLSAPRWSPDGDALAVVRQLPSVQSAASPQLRHRGELLLIDLGGRQIRIASVDDASRVLGWDDEGVLFTRFGRGDLPSEQLWRADPTTHALEPVLREPSGQVYRPQLHGDLLSYVRAQGSLATLPGPSERVELVVADGKGREIRSVPMVGAMPHRPRLKDGRMLFAVEGRPEGRAIDLRDGKMQHRLQQVPGWVIPPPGALLSSLTMPYIHQVYDTPNSFNGHWACGPTSTLMAIQHFGRLKTWPIKVNIPSAHTSNYGAYVALKYTFSGTTFDRKQNDASGKSAQGAYGWCTDGGGAWAWRMQDYAKKHDLKSDFSGSVSFSKVEAALKAGKVVVLSTQLTSAGHIITVKGTTSTGKLVVNDPYGDRNLPNYPNTKGEGAVYTWSQAKAKWLITVYGKPTNPIPSYKATLLKKSYPAAMVSGTTAQASVKYRNDGAASWSTDKTRLGTTEPQDRSSPFHTADWLSPSRAVAADAPAKPGESATFAFTLAAPKVCKETVYEEAFNLVQEGTAWFSAAKQGGPKDTDLVLTITVTPADEDGDGSNSCDDCDDADTNVFPGADEVCNGRDDDCDGETDEGLTCGPGENAPDAGMPGEGGLPPRHVPGQAMELQGGCSVAGGLSAPPMVPLLLYLLLLCRRFWR